MIDAAGRGYQGNGEVGRSYRKINRGPKRKKLQRRVGDHNVANVHSAGF